MTLALMLPHMLSQRGGVFVQKPNGSRIFSRTPANWEEPLSTSSSNLTHQPLWRAVMNRINVERNFRFIIVTRDFLGTAGNYFTFTIVHFCATHTFDGGLVVLALDGSNPYKPRMLSKQDLSSLGLTNSS